MQVQTYLMMVIYCGGDNAFFYRVQPSIFQAKHLSGGTLAAWIPAAALGRHGFLLCHEECVSMLSSFFLF